MEDHLRLSKRPLTLWWIAALDNVDPCHMIKIELKDGALKLRSLEAHRVNLHDSASNSEDIWYCECSMFKCVEERD